MAYIPGYQEGGQAQGYSDLSPEVQAKLLESNTPNDTRAWLRFNKYRDRPESWALFEPGGSFYEETKRHFPHFYGEGGDLIEKPGYAPRWSNEAIDYARTELGVVPGSDEDVAAAVQEVVPETAQGVIADAASVERVGKGPTANDRWVRSPSGEMVRADAAPVVREESISPALPIDDNAAQLRQMLAEGKLTDEQFRSGMSLINYGPSIGANERARYEADRALRAEQRELPREDPVLSDLQDEGLEYEYAVDSGRPTQEDYDRMKAERKKIMEDRAVAEAVEEAAPKTYRHWMASQHPGVGGEWQDSPVREWQIADAESVRRALEGIPEEKPELSFDNVPYREVESPEISGKDWITAADSELRPGIDPMAGPGVGRLLLRYSLKYRHFYGRKVCALQPEDIVIAEEPWVVSLV